MSIYIFTVVPTQPAERCETRNITVQIAPGHDTIHVEIKPGVVLTLSAGQHVYDDVEEACSVYINCISEELDLPVGKLIKLKAMLHL